MRFVETPIFTKVNGGFLDDEDYRALQSSLMRPSGAGGRREGLRRRAQSALGAGGRRKARQPAGAVLLAPRPSVVYMLYAYAKNEQGDLTPAQVRVLATLVREEFK